MAFFVALIRLNVITWEVKSLNVSIDFNNQGGLPLMEGYSYDDVVVWP